MSGATLTIRNVDPAIRERLRVRAARNGRSMEAELRLIVAEAVGAGEDLPVRLGTAIHRLFAPVGGAALNLPAREQDGDPPPFHEG